MKRFKIFISSVQKELQGERRAIKDFILNDPLFSRFVSDVFLFEDIPAGDRKPDDIYLNEVEGCDIYLAILGNEYGWKNEEGKSPTELEFEHATKTHRERLVFVKGDDDKSRIPVLNSAQVHCFHFHGTRKQKPIASQQPYEGRLFEIIDQAVEFVLGKIDRHVGTRAESTKAPVEFEIPRPVIAEAIVNAVAHRNYRSNGFVQVLVFADRIEAWNPGELPAGLTPELLREPHGPMPQNPLIAEPLFRVKYIEKAGTGTTDMIADCLEAGLPEPEFEQRGPHFVVTVWRDWLTEEVINVLKINARQVTGLKLLKIERKITTMEYQKFVGCSRRTAARDLDELLEKGVITRRGAGRGAHYLLNRNRAINVPIVP